MPHIIPIKDLCKTNQISELCQNTREAIYVTKNGYAELVIMNAQAYDAKLAKYEIYEKIAKGMQDIEEGKSYTAEEMKNRFNKYAE